ncbi:MAG: VIT1/CCC1 transporter family protein [Gloeobacteraceae cyanobacterium ES-bin-316]|nr:VIT1/CCC1 transporter family protein [Ferruginibacter sp.]
MSSENNDHYSQKPYKPFTDIIIGISDGLIVPFAITTGLSVIATSNHLIVQAGSIVLVAGAVIIGLGGYFAAKGRHEGLAQRTKEEEAVIQKAELDKTIRLFKELDLDMDMQNQAAVEIEKDSKEWKAYLQEHLPELELAGTARLPGTALIIGLSYALGGLIPLLPYAIIEKKETALIFSVVSTLLALLLFGYIRSKVNKEPLVWGTIRLTILGIAAAAAAFAVARIFTP